MSDPQFALRQHIFQTFGEVFGLERMTSAEKEWSASETPFETLGRILADSVGATLTPESLRLHVEARSTWALGPEQKASLEAALGNAEKDPLVVGRLSNAELAIYGGQALSRMGFIYTYLTYMHALSLSHSRREHAQGQS